MLGYDNPDITRRQKELADTFEVNHDETFVIDEAETTCGFVPGAARLYSQVTPGLYGLPPINMGAHRKVGGNGDFPNPGELLCAAIASCYDSSIRFISDRLNVELLYLKVRAKARVDVRGTLKLNRTSPVGFQSLDIEVEMEASPGTPDKTIRAILKAAEESCVVLQTIQHAPSVSWNFDIKGAATPDQSIIKE